MRCSPVFGPVMTTHLVESSMEMLMGTTGDGFPASIVLLVLPFVSVTPCWLLPRSTEMEAKADARREEGAGGLAVGFFCMCVSLLGHGHMHAPRVQQHERTVVSTTTH
jgi:hypothetical protein